MSVDDSKLDSFAALEHLTAEDRRQLALSLEGRTLKSGAKVCRQGEEADIFFLLVSGKADVSTRLPDGRRVHLGTLEAGAIFGQSGLVAGQERTADVVAGADVELLTLSRYRLERALKDGAPWAIKILHTVAAHLVRQVRASLERLESLDRAEGADRNLVEDAKVQRQSVIAPSYGGPVPTPSSRPVSENDELMQLLARAESSLAGSGYNLQKVSFVKDDRPRAGRGKYRYT